MIKIGKTKQSKATEDTAETEAANEAETVEEVTVPKGAPLLTYVGEAAEVTVLGIVFERNAETYVEDAEKRFPKLFKNPKFKVSKAK